MLKIKNTIKLLLLYVVLSGVNAIAGTITSHTEAPELGPSYIAQLNGPISDTENIDGAGITYTGDNDASTYVANDRSTQGQLFTTGPYPSGYTLNGIWVQHVLYTEYLNNGTYAALDDGTAITVRIVDPAKANTQGFVLHSEEATVAAGNGISGGGSWEGTGLWIYIELDTPVKLAPNKQYGFDLTSYGPHFELAGLDTDQYNGGSAYTTANKEDLNTGTLHTGDRVFVIPFEVPQLLASKPNPADNATDLQRDLVLSWKPGNYADTHNLFFGTDFNDVNDATIESPLGAAVQEGIDVNNYDIGRLEFDTTYYWRIDEVNSPSTPGIYKGQVWSFKVEPVALKVPASDITASASTSYGTDPNDTINESGLDPDNMDLHSSIQADMWLSTPEAPNVVWIRYDFDKAYKLHQMLVWNYNYAGMLLNAGFKDVIVEYSLDGQTWTEVPDVPQFEKGTGKNGYKYNTVVDLGDVVATSVRLRQQTNWGMQVSGLSEVRFTYIPVWAREPKPENEAVDVPIDTTLKWRAGRDAGQHNVYVSTDEQAVMNGTADVHTIGQASYGPLSLDLRKTYYWRVDEVNNSEIPDLWQGDVWSFTTEESLTVDDFEDYNNTQPDTVWDTWVDGLTDSTYGGSRMGNEYEPFCEEEIVHGGNQSAPLFYNNTSLTKSETVANTSNLAIGSDWTLGSPDTLIIWFRGDENNATTDQMYVKLNDTKIVYEGDVSDIARTSWKKWEINLPSLAGLDLHNVSSITIGVERAGATGGEGVIYLDDIELTLAIEAVDPGTDNLTHSYTFNDGTPKDSVGTANGTLVGGAAVSNGALVISDQEQWMDMPGDVIAINTYDEVTLEAWYTPSAGANTGNTMLAFFGQTSGTNGRNFIFVQPSRTDDTTRASISTTSGGAESYVSGPEYDDGYLHHVVVTIDAVQIKLYLDGDLIGTSELSATNYISGVSQSIASLGRSGFTNDPEWIGSIDEFNIYNCALSAGEVRYLYRN